MWSNKEYTMISLVRCHLLTTPVFLFLHSCCFACNIVASLSLSDSLAQLRLFRMYNGFIISYQRKSDHYKDKIIKGKKDTNIVLHVTVTLNDHNYFYHVTFYIMWLNQLSAAIGSSCTSFSSGSA